MISQDVALRLFNSIIETAGMYKPLEDTQDLLLVCHHYVMYGGDNSFLASDISHKIIGHCGITHRIAKAGSFGYYFDDLVDGCLFNAVENDDTLTLEHSLNGIRLLGKHQTRVYEMIDKGERKHE